MRIKNLQIGYENLTPAKARVIAHLIGDGCVYRSSETNYVIKLEVTDPESLDQFETDLISVYGLKPTRGTNRSGKTGKPIPFVSLLSKRAYDDLHTYCDFRSSTWFVPSQIFAANLPLKREFLRALFDDEGTVVRDGNSIKVRLYSINYNGLCQIQQILSQFGLECIIKAGYGCKRNVFGLIPKNTNLFAQNIGFNLRRKQSSLE
ncbi:MAG TPA: LAGLIDADG family homing endonuclease [Candidatus Nanoarchaeia archaeon]|nr:LAGLIDADG family homing endonuclease [Candidatus Nanoarchaeia archaeon]